MSEKKMCQLYSIAGEIQKIKARSRLGALRMQSTGRAKCEGEQILWQMNYGWGTSWRTFRVKRRPCGVLIDCISCMNSPRGPGQAEIQTTVTDDSCSN